LSKSAREVLPEGDFEPWTSKHKPLGTEEIVGNGSAVRHVYEWLKGWEGHRRALLLYGPPGVGKTASLEAAAHELGYNVLEMNASDVRTEERINELVLPAISSRSLSGKKRLILFDEVDGIYARNDSGGLAALLNILGCGTLPVAMTANDPWDDGLRNLRGKVEMVEFRRVPTAEVARRLREICKLEGVAVDETSLLGLAEAAGGDVRSSIEDLQASFLGGHPGEDVTTQLGQRQRQEKLFETLNGIFRASSVEGARRALDSSSENYEDIFEWVYEYLPKVLTRVEDLGRALEYLGRADVMLRRMKRTNQWSQLPYFMELFTAGAALSNTAPSILQVFYRDRPDRLKNRWKYFNASRRLSSSSLLLSSRLHCSSHGARIEALPLYMRAAKSKGGGGIAQALRDAGVELES
jgi:replication factor C large subunit